MRAVVLNKDCTLELRSIEKPAPIHGELLIKVGACGICGSDLRYLQGENPWAQQTLGEKKENPGNLVLGHEFAGEVVEVGDRENEKLLGRRVVGVAYQGCGVCEFCRSNRENLCKATRHIGHGAGWEERAYYPGAMADYTLAFPQVFPFSDALSYEEASTVDFLAIGLSAVRKAERVFAEDLLVIGSGPVGLGVLQFARLFGAKRVFCTDVSDVQLRVAEELGGIAVRGGADEAAEKILSATDGIGCATVFDTVGEPSTLRQGIGLTSSRGSLVSLVANDQLVKLPMSALSGERSLRTVANSPYRDLYQAMKMLEAGRVNVKPLITHVLPLDDYQKGFDMLLNREESGAIKVVLRP